MRGGAFQMTTMIVNGLLYTPILNADGEIVREAELEILNQTIDTEHLGLRRRISFVLLDEGPPISAAGYPPPSNGMQRVADTRGVRVSTFQTPPVGLMPVTLSADAALPLPIGMVDDLRIGQPGETPNTTGQHWVASAWLTNTILADVAWPRDPGGRAHSRLGADDVSPDRGRIRRRWRRRRCEVDSGGPFVSSKRAYVFDLGRAARNTGCRKKGMRTAMLCVGDQRLVGRLLMGGVLALASAAQLVDLFFKSTESQ
jgi:hypothetical protein